ncbi:MAG: hypothetical protein AAGG51_05165 [Cyanobacteria bacterium P01_G01_bin.54]
MFVETIEAVGTAVGVIEISKGVFPTFRKIFNRLKNGELTIAIFGAGGTGKTTLGKLLSGEFELGGLFQSYQESISIEQYKLDSDAIGSVIVAPGQSRREDTWDDLLRSLANGKIKLVIHVVSWGYHSFGEFGYTEHRLYRNGMSLEEFLIEYTEDHRNRELAVLKKIEPHLSIADQKKTIMITLVTKQDLWWKSRAEVSQHYVDGEYERLIQDIRDKRGAYNFIHEYRSTSLVMENFLSGVNELLVPTTQGYDQRLKFANFRYFLNAIEELFEISLSVQEN